MSTGGNAKSHWETRFAVAQKTVREKIEEQKNREAQWLQSSHYYVEKKSLIWVERKGSSINGPVDFFTTSQLLR